MPDEQLGQSHSNPPPRRTVRRLLIAIVLLLLIAVGSLMAARRIPAVQAEIDRLLGINGGHAESSPRQLPPPLTSRSPDEADQPAPTAVTPPANPEPAITAQLQASAETRLALLEERMSRLDLQAQAASGNAARAEALLVAFAARRTLDRGAPLGYLEAQLKLRFADAQPNAVQTLIDSGQAPVTLDQLYAQLGALQTKLTGGAPSEDSWTRLKRELSALFVVRRQDDASVSPTDNLARVKLLLASGKVSEAIAEVERLPGAASAQPWLAGAKRYEAAQRALDLIETTAMLEPRRLKDDDGTAIQQPSPLAPTAPTTAPTASSSTI
jgi:hypothetical protein